MSEDPVSVTSTASAFESFTPPECVLSIPTNTTALVVKVSPEYSTLVDPNTVDGRRPNVQCFYVCYLHNCYFV